MIGILGTRRSEVRPPSWPFDVNWGSWQSEGLATWWPMGYQSLGIGADLAGNYDLVNTGSDIVSDSGIYYARLFDDAIPHYMQIDRAPVTATPLTLCALFQSDSTTVSQSLINVGNSASAANRDQFLLYLNGAGANDFVVARTAAAANLSEANSSVGYVAGKLQHAAARFTSATDRAVFIDGGSKGTNTTSRVPSGVNRTTVGGINQATGTLYMSGLIADARIYNYALSDQQISELADPASRWNLYYPLGRKMWSFPAHTAGGGGGTILPLLNHYLAG